MKNSVDFKELKEIEKTILKGINLSNNFNNIKTIAGFDIAYSGKKYFASAVVVDLETKKEIENKTAIGEEIMPYSPNLAVFREGPAILDAYRNLENKPDILIIKGYGALKENKVGLASYIGVLVNKPCIGVAKELLIGRLDEDKIMVDNKIKGIAVRTKEFANPIYISPGHNIDLDTSLEIVKKLIIEPYRLPLVLHLAHKYANKGKN